MKMVMLSGLAVVGGLATAVQGHLMGILDQKLGSKESVLITYGGGGLLVALLMLPGMLRSGGIREALHKVPWYALTTGAIGLVIVWTIGYTVPRMGMAKAFTLMVASQLLFALLFDHLGLMGAAVRNLTPAHFLGLMLMVAGVWLVLS